MNTHTNPTDIAATDLEDIVAPAWATGREFLPADDTESASVRDTRSLGDEHLGCRIDSFTSLDGYHHEDVVVRFVNDPDNYPGDQEEFTVHFARIPALIALLTEVLDVTSTPDKI